MTKRAAMLRWGTVVAVPVISVLTFAFWSRPKPPDVCDAQTKALIAWIDEIRAEHTYLWRGTMLDVKDVVVVAPRHSQRARFEFLIAPEWYSTGTRYEEPGEYSLWIPPPIGELADEFRKDSTENTPLSIGLRVDRDVPWSRVVKTVDEISRGGPTQLLFEFLEKRSLLAPPSHRLGEILTDRMNLLGATEEYATDERYLFRVPRLVGLQCSAASLMAAVGDPTPEKRKCWGYRDMDGEEFVALVAKTMPACDCAIDVDLLKSFAWNRFGPGVADSALRAVFSTALTPAHKYSWMEYRAIVAAVASLNPEAEAQEISFEGSAPWGDVAQSFVDAVNKAGAKPVRFVVKAK